MKKSLIWISASLTTLSALASNDSIGDQTVKTVSNKSNYNKILHASRVIVNADGSAHVFDAEGKITYINSETIDMLKKVNPGVIATLKGSVPCVGKSK